jgi:hypothetical protein
VTPTRTRDGVCSASVGFGCHRWPVGPLFFVRGGWLNLIPSSVSSSQNYFCQLHPPRSHYILCLCLVFLSSDQPAQLLLNFVRDGARRWAVVGAEAHPEKLISGGKSLEWGHFLSKFCRILNFSLKYYLRSWLIDSECSDRTATLDTARRKLNTTRGSMNKSCWNSEFLVGAHAPFSFTWVCPCVGPKGLTLRGWYRNPLELKLEQPIAMATPLELKLEQPIAMATRGLIHLSKHCSTTPSRGTRSRAAKTAPQNRDGGEPCPPPSPLLCLGVALRRSGGG